MGLQALYSEWKRIKGYDKLDPKENVGQNQSSMQEVFSKTKRPRHIRPIK